MPTHECCECAREMRQRVAILDAGPVTLLSEYKEQRDRAERAESALAELRDQTATAFKAGWNARGRACYPTPMDFELSTALEAWAAKEQPHA